MCSAVSSVPSITAPSSNASAVDELLVVNVALRVPVKIADMAGLDCTKNCLGDADNPKDAFGLTNLLLEKLRANRQK